MVDYTNKMLTIFRIIYKYVRYVFGKHDILPEGSVQTIGTEYMEAK